MQDMPFSSQRPNHQKAPIPAHGKGALQPDIAAIALQGDIAAIALQDIFQLIDLAALSGKLEVHSSSNSGSFYFSNGLLTYAVLQINQRKIGEILLESQVITQEQLQECLRLHKQGLPQRRFGQILLEKGYIPSGELDDSLLRQIKEAFFEALSWKEGTFTFYQNQTPAQHDLQLMARVDHLLLEGMIHLDHSAAAKS